MKRQLVNNREKAIARDRKPYDRARKHRMFLDDRYKAKHLPLERTPNNVHTL